MTMRYQDTRKIIMHITFTRIGAYLHPDDPLTLSQTYGVSVLMDFRIPADLSLEDLPEAQYHRKP